MEKQVHLKPLKAEVTVLNKHGLHLRFAGGLSAIASKYNSHIVISRGRRGVDAKSMLDLVSLSAAPGSRLSVTVTGEDALPALEAVTTFFGSYCGDK